MAPCISISCNALKRAGLFDYVEEATRRRSDALLIIISKYISIPIFKMGRRSQREIGHRLRIMPFLT